ncbi:MAG: general secretion pathway protein GspB [Pseudomonadales bacterium]|nr:general secretion pathway protein GspB [Pseudomonadales bacterium]
MSLVLEALRRQQAEREQDPAAVMLMHAGRRQRTRLWPIVLTCALLLNAGVFAWIFIARSDGTGAPAETVHAGETAPPGPVAAAAAAPADPAVVEPVAAIPEPVPEPAPAQPMRVIVERLPLGSLPAGVRNRFPGIAFSTHIYAEDPTLRAIVANGERLQEGDRVRDMLIREITEDGVVLEFENYLVEVPVFTDW